MKREILHSTRFESRKQFHNKNVRKDLTRFVIRFHCSSLFGFKLNEILISFQRLNMKRLQIQHTHKEKCAK